MCYLISKIFKSYRVVKLTPEQLVSPRQSVNIDYNQLYRTVTTSPMNYVTPQQIEQQRSPMLESNLISLYDANDDNVIELVDTNLTSSIYNSPKLWIVQFYAHWCGHCQRFAPIWKKSANMFRSK